MGENGLSKEVKGWFDIAFRKMVDDRLEAERQKPYYVSGTGIKRECNPIYIEIEDAFCLFSRLEGNK